MKSFRNFKHLLFAMLLALVLFVAVGCGGSKIELSFENEEYTVEVGKELPLNPEVKNEKDEEYTLVFESEDDSIATYSSGKVKGIAVGEVKVKVSLEGNTKIFAEVNIKVIEAKKFKVTFNTDGGTEIAAVEITDGSKVAKPSEPTKEGFVFVNWYSDSAKTKVYDFDAPVVSELTLYVKWEVARYNVSFDANGGSEVKGIGVNHGGTITAPEAPTKNGYNFVGWFSDKDLKNEFNFETKVTKDLTLYAKWEVAKYNLEFLLSGGQFDGDAPASTYTAFDEDIVIPNAVKAGNEFLGWFDNPTFSGDAISVIKKGTVGDLKLYARFVPIKHTVTFNTNGGSSIDAIEINEGSKLMKPADPTKEGFILVGWFTDEDLNNEFNFDTQILESITLYAKWLDENDVYEVELNWEYENKEEEMGAFLYDFYVWLDSKELIDKTELSFADFSGIEKDGTGVDSKYIGEWIKYIGLTGDALGLGSEYYAGSVNYLRLMGPRDTAPNTIDDRYFLNSTEYNAKWAQWGNFIHDDTKKHTNRFWSEGVGPYDFIRYVTNINNADSSYIKDDKGGTDFNLGKFSMKFTYHEYSPAALPVVTKLDSELAAWNTKEDGSGDKYLELPLDNPVDLVLYATWAMPKSVNTLLVDPSLTMADGEEFDFNNLIFEVGVTAFVSLEDALAVLQEGQTLILRAGTYEHEFALNVSNVIIQGAADEKAVITRKITLTGVNGITIRNLEFTELGQIYAEGKFDRFVFDNNKVYDITILASDYAPKNRIDVNAFIQLYTLSGVNQLGDITITNNVFNGVAADIISLDRTSVDKVITITDNEFRNFGVGAIRFDGGYNNGTYNILRNKFENDELGGSAAIVFRAYSSSAGETQTINIEYNSFKNIGDVDNQTPEDEHPVSSVINTSVFNDQNATINIKNNVFENNVNDIHLRNVGAKASNWVANVNNNQFLGTKGYIYYEAVDLADLNHNYFEDADGVAITDLEVLAELIKTNTNYSELGSKDN